MTCSLLLFADMPGRCLYCGDVLPKYRRKWCDDECSLTVATNHLWVLAKVAVYKREQGKCQLCGCKVWNSSDIYLHPERPRHPHTVMGASREELRGAWEQHRLEMEAFNSRVRPFMAEVNHIVPRLGRGYNSGCHNHLDNLELLCHQCHVGVTRQQRADRKSVLVSTA